MRDMVVIVWSLPSQILKEPLNATDPHLGVLTTMNRDAWAAARDELLAGVCLCLHLCLYLCLCLCLRPRLLCGW